MATKTKAAAKPKVTARANAPAKSKVTAKPAAAAEPKVVAKAPAKAKAVAKSKAAPKTAAKTKAAAKENPAPSTRNVKKFNALQSQDFTISDNLGVIGQVRIKPNAVAWKPKRGKAFHQISLDQLAAFATEHGREVQK